MTTDFAQSSRLTAKSAIAFVRPTTPARFPRLSKPSHDGQVKIVFP
jgi:hypothetical protein